ncbi:DUF3187 family protein [Thioalkalivibrio sp. XN279]|uniref:DUF3187 family protein n=1 Tax=Thioalkalivibrio sp. XN279 TaxID=2714953 RepID=UPI001408581A|nr:DUF3187 family protein [Thioalkalivibrio sp. XN279]NHA14708.1 DUF3187 family protein [Thioalkalivibrio sp. XN279]
MKPSPTSQVRGALYLLALLLTPSGPALAQAVLFDVHNQHPLVQLHAPPAPGERAPVAPGQWRWDLGLRLNNNSIQDGDAEAERIVLDGETYRSAFTVSRGLRPGLAVAATVPLVAHSSGFMDGFITDWHDLWGLSNERRNAFENNQLDFSYLQDGAAQVALRESARGLGDVRLDLDWHVRPAGQDQRSLVLRGGVKLPTGSSDRLLGSGGTDLSLQVLSSDHRSFAAWNVSLAWSLGALWLGESEVLDSMREDFVGIASAGLRWRMNPRFEAGMQVDLHTAVYDSELRALGAGGIQLTTGVGLRLRDSSLVELAMLQNLRTDTIPDFGLYLGWRSAP